MNNRPRLERLVRHGGPGLALLIGLGWYSARGAELRQRLSDGWEFYQGSLGSTWEIWRGDLATDNVTWTPVTVPHCLNARDAVDPDVRYYQGPGWYRTRLKLANPFPNGRTLLHFDGAGQQSRVFIGTEKVGEHLGGTTSGLWISPTHSPNCPWRRAAQFRWPSAPTIHATPRASRPI